MIRNLLISAAAALVLSGAAYFKGRGDGRALEVARQIEARDVVQAALDNVGQEIVDLTIKLGQKRKERAKLAQEIEDEARNDPDSGDRRISPDSLLRLERRWGPR